MSKLFHMNKLKYKENYIRLGYNQIVNLKMYLTEGLCIQNNVQLPHQLGNDNLNW